MSFWDEDEPFGVAPDLDAEQQLELSRPARSLIERKALDGAAADGEDPEHSVLLRARVAAALTVPVDLEPETRLQLGEQILTHFDPHPRRPHGKQRFLVRCNERTIHHQHLLHA